jgi:Phage capsid family
VTYWVSGDTGLKQTSEAAWAGVTLTAEEIACIVPILEAVIDDASFDVWAELRPALAEAIAQTLDAAAIGGINKPTSWPAAVVPAAIAAGTCPELIVANGLAPVGITVSPPRWRLPYELAGTIGALAPHGLRWIDDRAEFVRRYRERLDRVGVPASHGARKGRTSTTSARASSQRCALTGGSARSISARWRGSTPIPAPARDDELDRLGEEAAQEKRASAPSDDSSSSRRA